MKIKNKYIRNKHYRNLYWNRVRVKKQPFKTLCPYYMGIAHSKWSYEKQVDRNFDQITTEARAMENGHHRSFFHAPKHYRKDLWKKRKSQERAILARIRQGDYDAEMPKFKKDADWHWF